jgi:hypothetical protein
MVGLASRHPRASTHQAELKHRHAGPLCRSRCPSSPTPARSACPLVSRGPVRAASDGCRSWNFPGRRKALPIASLRSPGPNRCRRRRQGEHPDRPPHRNWRRRHLPQLDADIARHNHLARRRHRHLPVIRHHHDRCDRRNRRSRGCATLSCRAPPTHGPSRHPPRDGVTRDRLVRHNRSSHSR